MVNLFIVVMEEISSPKKLFSRIFSQIANSVLTEVNLLLLLFLTITRSFASDKGKSFAEIFSSRTKLNLDNVPVSREMVKKSEISSLPLGHLVLIAFQQLNQLLSRNFQTFGFSVTMKNMVILQISRMFQVYSIHYVLLSADMADSIVRAFNRSCVSQVVAFHVPRT